MENILKELGINTEAETVETLKAKCFEVFETPSMIFSPITNELVEDGFFTVSNSNGKIHGKVASENSLLPLQDLIDIAYEVNLELDLGLKFGEASVVYIKDESVAELRIPMGVSSFRNKRGIDDSTKLWLFVRTGFGGVSCTEIGIYTWRFACKNGVVMRRGLNYFKCKHTERMNEKVKVFLSEKLPKMGTSVQDFTSMAQRFDAKDITRTDIEAFRQKFFGYKKGDELSTKKQNMIAEFNLSLKEETKRAGNTVWALFQSATNYTNHRHYNASKDFNLVGTGATLNETAESFCLELTK